MNHSKELVVIHIPCTRIPSESLCIKFKFNNTISVICSKPVEPINLCSSDAYQQMAYTK